MKPVDQSVYAIVGMSPGNSYFKDDEVKYLLKTAVERYGRVAVMVADVPAISTYIAFGYPENIARREKAIPQGNLLKNRAKRAMEALGYTEEQVKIFNWGSEIEPNAEYQSCYKNIRELYDKGENFRHDADETTQAVLVGSKRNIPDLVKATKIAVHYLLSEFAFMEWAPKFLQVEKTTYIYHKNWPVFENYIAGKYDGVIKSQIDFLLIENPWETYSTLANFEEELDSYENSLDRVQKTKILRVAFSNYPPALIHDEEKDSFSGIFYEVINSVAKKNGWEIVWSEETGYGVIVDGLESKRFDIFGSAVWPTPERKEIASFSESLYKSPVFAWVREDCRSSNDEIHNDTNVRIVIKENDISHSIASADYSKGRLVYVPQLADTSEVLRFVAEGKGDVTFAEPYLVELFNRDSKMKLIPTTDQPIRFFENTFMFSRLDMSLKDIFDVEIEQMKSSGVLSALIKKYTGREDTFFG